MGTQDVCDLPAEDVIDEEDSTFLHGEGSMKQSDGLDADQEKRCPRKRRRETSAAIEK